MSTICGLPSLTLFTILHEILLDFKNSAVPFVATILNPILESFCAILIEASLSSSLILIKTIPLLGNNTLEANCDFKKASPNVFPTPITSPVDFISGPKIGSAPGNLMNGKTASLIVNKLCFNFFSF